MSTTKVYRLADPEVAAAPRYIREIRHTLDRMVDLLVNAEGFRDREVGNRLRSLAEIADDLLAQLTRVAVTRTRVP